MGFPSYTGEEVGSICLRKPIIWVIRVLLHTMDITVDVREET
eukprot:gene23437-9693_t